LNSYPVGFVGNNPRFCGMVHQEGDDRLFLVPFSSNMLLYLNATDNTFTQITWPANAPLTANSATWYYGGTISQHGKLYLNPNTANCLIIIDIRPQFHPSYPSSAICQNDGWPDGYTKSSADLGGISVDANYLWMVPFSGTAKLIRMHLETLVMAAFIMPRVGYTGAVFTGKDHWMMPRTAATLMRATTPEGIISEYTNNWGGGEQFSGGTFDGRRLWLSPRNHPGVLSFDLASYNSHCIRISLPRLQSAQRPKHFR